MEPPLFPPEKKKGDSGAAGAALQLVQLAQRSSPEGEALDEERQSTSGTPAAFLEAKKEEAPSEASAPSPGSRQPSGGASFPPAGEPQFFPTSRRVATSRGPRDNLVAHAAPQDTKKRRRPRPSIGDLHALLHGQHCCYSNHVSTYGAKPCLHTRPGDG